MRCKKNAKKFKKIKKIENGKWLLLAGSKNMQETSEARAKELICKQLMRLLLIRVIVLSFIILIAMKLKQSLRLKTVKLNQNQRK